MEPIRSIAQRQPGTQAEGQPVLDDVVFLSGRPPMGEFLGFVAAQAEGGQQPDVAALADEWRQANDRIRNLEVKEAGAADNPPMRPLPAPLEPLREQLLKDPIFRRSFQIVPADVCMVELDRLVVFQKFINLRYVEELKLTLGKAPSPEAVFRFCLPVEHVMPPVQFRRVAGNAYTFVSPSTDLRFLESAHLRGDQVVDYLRPGPIVGVVGLVVGFGGNFLQAVHAENRLILGNGSHRAYALRDLGVHEVPCVVQRVSRREELEVVGVGDVAARPELYLQDRRPPMLKDYFDDALHAFVRVPRSVRQVRVTFGVEVLDAPASA